MILGNILLTLSLATALAALYYYFLATRGQGTMLRYGRWATLALAGAVLLASAYLMYLILNDTFQVSFVWENSSRDLPLFYKISSFWGGQEGSILLWLTMGVLIGVSLSIWFRHLEKDPYEPYVMFIITAVQLFPIVLLMAKSPFRLLPDVPLDGNGLNPLLQDPYMVIHPPILFSGFAGLSIPFAFALAALWRRDYTGWVVRVWPWALLGWGLLGLGLAIGGFWAYRVLGWGGYWGWDPVENSSLVPWLVGAGLIHGLITQKSRGTLVRWNLFLAPLAYILVLYSTFLTRSGVLANFSVHTFGESPLAPYMMAAIAIAATASFGLFVARYREIPGGSEVFTSFLSREFMFLVAIVAFVFGAIAVTIGTSSPIITGLFGQQSQVSVSFYSITGVPIALVGLVVLSLAPILAWTTSKQGKVLNLLRYPALLGAVGAAIGFVLGARAPMAILYIFMSCLALGTNAVMITRIVRANVWKIGGYLAHVGVALLLIGIIGSSFYAETQRIMVVEGQSAEAFGYTFSFEGLRPLPRDRWAMQVRVTKGEESFLAEPRLYPTDMGMVRNPHIHKYWHEDLYISPGDYDPGTSGGSVLLLAKGETTNLNDTTTLKFISFDRIGHDTADPAGTIVAGAILEVTTNGVTTYVTPTIKAEPGKDVVRSQEQLPNNLGTIMIDGIDASSGRVQLFIQGPQVGPVQPPFITLEISRHPFVNLVWVGLLTIFGGTVIAAQRRRLEALSILETILQREAAMVPQRKRGKVRPRHAPQPGQALPLQKAK
jgi:cytochrome c-type biogenesis protein CcmF